MSRQGLSPPAIIFFLIARPKIRNAPQIPSEVKSEVKHPKYYPKYTTNTIRSKIRSKKSEVLSEMHHKYHPKLPSFKGESIFRPYLLIIVWFNGVNVEAN